MDFKKSGILSKSTVTKSELKIFQNVYEFKDTIVQISNVTRVYALKRKKESNLLAVLIALMTISSFFTMIQNKFEGLYTCTFLITLVVCIFFVLKAKKVNDDFKNFKDYLVIDLNSGLSIYFLCKDRAYTKIVIEKIKECMNGNGTGYIFNFENCDISQIGDNYKEVDKEMNIYDNTFNNNAQFGEESKIEVNGDMVNNVVYNNQIDWNMWDKAIEQSLKKIDENSSYYFIAKEAEMYVEDRDKEGLGKLIKKYGVDFAKNVLVGIAANEARNLISMFLK